MINIIFSVEKKSLYLTNATWGYIDEMLFISGYRMVFIIDPGDLHSVPQNVLCGAFRDLKMLKMFTEGRDWVYSPKGGVSH